MPEQTSIDVDFKTWWAMLRDLSPRPVGMAEAHELLHNVMYAASRGLRCYMAGADQDIDLTEAYEKYRTWHILKGDARHEPA